MERLIAGDPAAFSEIYAHMRPRIFGFLLRLTRNRSVAEELLQDTFVKLAQNAHALRPDTELSAWLFTVARNAAISHLRWAALDASRILLWATKAAPMLTPEEEVASNAGARALETALSKLSLPDREVLLLVAVEDFSTQTAAAILKLTDATFRQRLSRARQRLAALLESPHATAKS